MEPGDQLQIQASHLSRMLTEELTEHTSFDGTQDHLLIKMRLAYQVTSEDSRHQWRLVLETCSIAYHFI